MGRFFLLAAYVALVLVSTCVENSSAEKAPSSFLRTAHLARALEGTCQLEGNNDCELLTETECKNTNLECTWESDVNCCEDGGGAGPNFSLDNFSLDELDALVVLQCIAGVFAITFLNMIFLAIIYHKQHLANLSKSLLASASQAQGVVLETTRRQSSGEGATTYTYFVSFQFQLPDGRTVVCRNQEISSMGDVDKLFYETLESRPPVTVLYDPNSPINCAIKEIAEMAAGINMGCLKGICYSVIVSSTIGTIVMGFVVADSPIVAIAAFALTVIFTLPGLTCCKTFVREKLYILKYFQPGGGQSVSI